MRYNSAIIIVSGVVVKFLSRLTQPFNLCRLRFDAVGLLLAGGAKISADVVIRHLLSLPV
jgi:hypothetical protein